MTDKQPNVMKDASAAVVVNGDQDSASRRKKVSEEASTSNKREKDAVKPWWLTSHRNFLGRLGKDMDSKRSSASSAVAPSPHHLQYNHGAGATIVSHHSSAAVPPGRRFKLPRNTNEIIPDARLTAREFFYLLSAFMLLFLAASVTAQDLSIMVNLVAFVYPAFFSIRALESMRPRELEKWLTYWVVFGFVNIGEIFSDNLLWWFPYYWFMKSTFMVWCFLPIENNGSFYMYDNVIRPAYNSNGDEFEALIDSVKKNFLKFYNTVKEKTGDFAKRLSREEHEREAARSRMESNSSEPKSPNANKVSSASKGMNTSTSQMIPSSIIESGSPQNRPGAGSSNSPYASPLQQLQADNYGAGGPGTADAITETENRVIYLTNTEPTAPAAASTLGDLDKGEADAPDPEQQHVDFMDPIDKVIREWQESPSASMHLRARRPV